MWWLYFATAALLLLFLFGVFAALHHAYAEALEAFRLAKFAGDQWRSFVSQLGEAICKAAESKAVEAVKTLDAGRYRELGPLLEGALAEVRNKTLLKGVDLRWAFRGDVFTWNATFLGHRAGGVVDWLRPTEFIHAARLIGGASFDLGEIEGALRALTPRGAVLRGVAWGRLYGNGTYAGYLHGVYMLTDKTPLRCIPGRLSASIHATHYVVYSTNSTAPWVDVYEIIYVDN
ncbi:MAG: hypothetical protein ACK4SY_05295 [Pyrobaculum sp.]